MVWLETAPFLLVRNTSTCAALGKEFKSNLAAI